MFLSKLVVDFRNRQARRDLADPYEMHRTLMCAFPDAAKGGPGRVMFRIDLHPDTGEPAVLVQSDRLPVWSQLRVGFLATPACCKPMELTFRASQRLIFRLRANPTVKRDGRRFGLFSEDQQRAWLVRKGNEGGFRPGLFQVAPEGLIAGQKGDQQLTHFAVCFDGLLTVTEPDLFLQTVHLGIGSAKGFGFGLLSIAPVEE